MVHKQQIKVSLDTVMAMDRTTLVVQWQSQFDSSSSKQLTVDFMRQAIGWQVQSQKYGGLDGKTRRLLLSGLAFTL